MRGGWEVAQRKAESNLFESVFQSLSDLFTSKEESRNLSVKLSMRRYLGPQQTGGIRTPGIRIDFGQVT